MVDQNWENNLKLLREKLVQLNHYDVFDQLFHSLDT